MIGVTLTSPRFASLAFEAQERFEASTGLPSICVRTPVEKNYLVKLELARMFKGQTVVYFDADLWFIKKADLSIFEDKEAFLAARDPGIYDKSHFPMHDSRNMGLDLERYFNSGFFIWNDRHKPLFERATQIYRQNKATLKDFGEQSVLNAAAQEYGSVELVSNTYNYMPFAEQEKLEAMEIVKSPNTIHAAGFSSTNKKRALEYYENHYKFSL